MRPILLLLLLAGFFCAGSEARSAEFRLDGPTIELSKLQFCTHCHRPLSVNGVAEGAAIRCPHCEKVQRRLPDRLLLKKVYQVCPRCGARMDVNHLKPRSQMRCGSCGLYQYVLPEAVRKKSVQDGTGRPPAAVEVQGTNPPTPSKRADGPPLKQSFQQNPAPLPRKNDPRHIERNFPPPQSMPTAPGSTPANKTIGSRPPQSYTDLETLDVAATVNGRPVLTADLDREVAEAIQKERLRLGRAAYTPGGQDLLKKQETLLQPKILQALIGRELILDAAEQAGFAPTSAQVLEEAEALLQEPKGIRDPKELMREARTRLVIAEMRRRHGRATGQIAPEDVRAFYNTNLKRFMQPDTIALQALIIYTDRAGRPDSRAADAIASEIAHNLKRKVSFLSLLKRHSEGPLATTAQGRFPPKGLMPVAGLARTVRAALVERKPGDIIGPVELTPGKSSGLVFLKILARDEAVPIAFDKVKQEIETSLHREQQRLAFDQWVDSLRDHARIQMK